MALRRFQVDDISPPVVCVSGEQAVHALRVLRLKPGSSVILFDGRGGEVVGRILSTSAEAFEVEVVERKAKPESQGVPLCLAVAMPKGPRGDWLVEKCAELGVSQLWPLACERGQVEPGEGKLARWRRKAIEAAKQSRQANVMTVEEATTLAALLDGPARSARLFFGEPRRARSGFAQELHESESRTKMELPFLVIIGPEGGLTDEECRQIESKDGKAVFLSPTILRVETAAVAVAAVWASWTAAAPKQ